MDNNQPRPREILVTYRDDKYLANAQGERLERLARILSLVAIPVVIAVSGKFIEGALSSQEVNQRYVEIAVSILTESDPEEDGPLRAWAVDLLDQSAPAKFGSVVSERLATGQTSLPVSAQFRSEPVGPRFPVDGQNVGLYDQAFIQAYDDGSILVGLTRGSIFEQKSLEVGLEGQIQSLVAFTLIETTRSFVALTDGRSVFLLDVFGKGSSVLAKLSYLSHVPTNLAVNEDTKTLTVSLSNDTTIDYDLYQLLGFDPSTRAPI